MTYDAQAPVNVEAVRAWFPSITPDFAFLENAGGSQVPGVVAEAVRDYMLASYVQLGASYRHSQRATAVVDEAHRFIETFMNADGIGRVALGPSTSVLVNQLAQAYGETMQPGDEVIVAETNHESNAGPWVRLARYGVKVHIWKVDPETFECPLEALEALLNERTRIVALPHVSNLLGQIVDLKPVCEAAHRIGARVVADGVAYAPHQAIDVAEWGVDWYVYSTYKVYGPHMAALFGRHEAFAEVTGPNHFFIPADSIPYKMELGGVLHEGCAGLLALRPYLRFLAGRETDDRTTIEAAFATMEALERAPAERLCGYLRGKEGVLIVGQSSGRAVGTVSFLSDRATPEAVVRQTVAQNIGIRHGHMYAYRLCEALGIAPEPGVVRVSLAHYNTVEEVERLIEALEQVL